MFKISPVQDIETAKKYAALCGVKYIDGAFVYAMTDIDDGSLMGISQFELLSDYGYITDLATPAEEFDFEAMFILGRQTMNFIEMCGHTLCKVRNGAASADFIKALGFSDRDGEYSTDMTGMFDGKCGNH